MSDRRPYPEKARSRIEASNAIELLLENANRPARKDAAPRIIELILARAKGRQWKELEPEARNSLCDLLVKEFSALELSNAQVQGLLGLIKKVLPDTAQIEMKGEGRVTHFVRLPVKERDSQAWAGRVIEAERNDGRLGLAAPTGAADIPVGVSG